MKHIPKKCGFQRKSRDGLLVALHLTTLGKLLMSLADVLVLFNRYTLDICAYSKLKFKRFIIYRIMYIST